MEKHLNLLSYKELLELDKNKNNTLDDLSLYTEKELDSINYFKGKDFYAKQQDPGTDPNLFDTRRSFLVKMRSSTAREKFLKSFNYLYD